MTTMDALRDRILSHSLGVVSARGLSALSIGDLARDLELSRSGLLAHFSDKEALQLGVIEKAAALFVQEVAEAGTAAGTGETRLRALFTRWLAWSRGPRLNGGCPFVHASAESDALPPAVRGKLEAFLSDWTETLKAAIEDAKTAGELAAGTDADQLVFELYGLYLSHHFWHWSMKDRAALDRTMRAFERVLLANAPAKAEA
jgi:AcrR family transcriptional regulator